MPFWIYGKDAKTGRPAEMLSDAATPEAAREQATAQGITAERVEPAGAARPAEPPEGPVLDTTWPGEPARGQSGPQYEFTPGQNATFRELAATMRFVGLFLVLGGALECLTCLNGQLGGLVAGLVFVFLGIWTRSAAQSFQRIVDTEGRDITHLMTALSDLLKMYRLLYILLIIALVLFAVAAAIGLVTALAWFGFGARPRP